MKAKVLQVTKLTSKNGKPFQVLQLQDPITGLSGDYVDFTNDVFAIGSEVNVLPEIYRYKWQLKLTK